MSCSARCGPGTNPQIWDAWIACAEVAPQPLVDDSVLVNYAAAAGGQSTSWTLCFAVAILKTRRMLYFKANPGDCGSAGYSLTGSSLATLKIASGLGTAARLDPEPITQGILSGIASITGLFGAHHAAAVKNEQTIGCSVATALNEVMVQLEQAVKEGYLTGGQAQAALVQAVSNLDAELASIAKSCNVACGMRIGLRALVSYCHDIVWQALSPEVNVPILTPILASPPLGSPGAPGTIPGTGAPVYSGASGYTPTPFNANNPGFGNSSIPASITPGTILLIGGVAFVASKL